MYILLLSFLFALTDAAMQKKPQAQYQPLAGNDPQKQIKGCSDPAVLHANRDTCTQRKSSGKIKKKCTACPLGKFDKRSLRNGANLLNTANICVFHVAKNCVQPESLPSTNTMKEICGGNFGNCGLLPQTPVLKNMKVNRVVADAVMGNIPMPLDIWFDVENYKAGAQGTTFLHVTTPDASAKILGANPPLLKAYNSDDPDTKRFGTSENNYDARHYNGVVCLYPVPQNLQPDALIALGREYAEDVQRKFRLKQSVHVLKVTVPRNFEVAPDAVNDKAVYHYGDIEGSLIHNFAIELLTRIEIQVDPYDEPLPQQGGNYGGGGMGDIGVIGGGGGDFDFFVQARDEVEVQGRRAEVELKQKMQFMGFIVFLVVFVIFIIHKSRSYNKSDEMYELLPGEI